MVGDNPLFLNALCSIYSEYLATGYGTGWEKLVHESHRKNKRNKNIIRGSSSSSTLHAIMEDEDKDLEKGSDERWRQYRDTQSAHDDNGSEPEPILAINRATHGNDQATLPRSQVPERGGKRSENGPNPHTFQHLEQFKRYLDVMGTRRQSVVEIAHPIRLGKENGLRRTMR